MSRSALYSLPIFKAAVFTGRIVPRWLAQRIAVVVADLVYGRFAGARAALSENLRAFTSLDDAAIERICVENIRNFARMLADYFCCAAGNSAGDLLAEWRGVENLEQARAQGHGVILVTAHLGNWELGGLLLARHGLPMNVTTLEEPTSALTQWRDGHRQRAGVRTVAVGPGHSFSFVEMIHALRRNEVVAMLVDRPYAGTGAAVKFFGHVTEFSTAPALLWQHTNAPVVPAFVLRNAEGRYTAFAAPALPFTRTDDPRADLVTNTQLIATHFENVIRENPTQWFNYVPIWTQPASTNAARR